MARTPRTTARPALGARAAWLCSAPLVLLGACVAPDWERDADRDVARILDDGTRRAIGDREARAARPRPGSGASKAEAEALPGAGVRPAGGAEGAPGLGAPSAATAGETTVAPGAEARVEGAPGRAAEREPAARAESAAAPAPTRVLSLAEALDTAVRSNRELLGQKDSLYQTALGLTGTRYAFSPRVASALGYVFSGTDAGGSSHGATWSASVAQQLPTGGDVSITGSTGFASGGGNTYDASVAIHLTQPLLRGAGRDIAWESLTQAERSLLYAIRNFELFRESFSIDVARRFYELVQQKQALENQRRNLEGFVFGRKQAEALFSVGRTNELEVLRARRSELTSQNSLIEAEESLRLALDRFRIFLGLSEGEHVDVRDEEPAFVEVDFDVDSAVAVALENRLDWLNQKEQLEDARRGVRIAKNGLLPDLALSLDYGLATGASATFGGRPLDDGSYGAALSLDLPLQRTNERNAYRSSQLALASAERAVAQFQDDLVASVRSTFRELARRQQSLAIQEQLIADQVRNAKIAQLRFEQGDFSNRDLVEAQEALLEARNALIQEKVAYEIARLGLLKDLGLLFIDEKGMWKE
ncbi:MAG: TolC family protein [Planctomycetes bacterium]|nr:TolC family protein [Planctomycetota bacterium]